MRERRANPDDSILSALIGPRRRDRLSTGEVVRWPSCVDGRVETTGNLIGNGAVALIGDPDSWTRFAGSGPGAEAIEEMLRYDSPVQLTSAIATEEVKVGGRVIPASRTVVVAIGGADRDRRCSSGRTSSNRSARSGGTLSFSLGLHRCLGDPLGRLEAASPSRR